MTWLKRRRTNDGVGTTRKEEAEDGTRAFTGERGQGALKKGETRRHRPHHNHDRRAQRAGRGVEA